MIKDFNDNYKLSFAEDINLYCKFNNLKIGKKYCSAHNGRQVYLTDITDDEYQSIKKIILPLEEFLKVDVFYS